MSDKSLMGFVLSHFIIRVFKEQGIKDSTIGLGSNKNGIIPFHERVSKVNGISG
jgi:hypothetical protein